MYEPASLPVVTTLVIRSVSMPHFNSKAMAANNTDYNYYIKGLELL